MSRAQITTIAITILLIAFLGYQNVNLRDENAFLFNELTATQDKYASTTKTLSGVIGKLQTDLEEAIGENEEKKQELQSTLNVLAGVQDNLQTTQQNLEQEKAKMGILTEQVSSISNVVGDIEKLATTDKELLEKYSKVYFLNEHYIPEDMVQIDLQYVYDTSRRYWMLTKIAPAVEKMVADMRSEDIDVSVYSAYRSFYEQGYVKAAHTTTYGEGANQFSADQGYSEHQLGTTIDFTTDAVGSELFGFENMAAYDWLKANAYTYGFIESYPQGNQYYVFEPWHWRFVGVALAKKLHDDGEHFYDLDQRTINNYLISFFDNIPG